jgi:hypothetical protein
MQPANDISRIPASRQAMLMRMGFRLVNLSDCDVWASKMHRKIFSFRWVETHTDEQLQVDLSTIGHAWAVYMGPDAPPDLVKRVDDALAS